MLAVSGVGAVQSVFHGDAGFDDMPEKQLQKWKKVKKAEDKEQARQQLKMAQQQLYYQGGREQGIYAPYCCSVREVPLVNMGSIRSGWIIMKVWCMFCTLNRR